MTKAILVGDAMLQVTVRGSGRPLLLVHGFPLDHTMWRHQIERFSADFQVIAPDLRGFGQSQLGNHETLGMADFADDLAAILDALDVITPIVFCGLSMGGYIAWQFVERYGQRLDKLVLCDTVATPDSPEAVRTRHDTADCVLAEGPGFLAEAMIEKLFAEATRREQPDVIEWTRQVIRGTSRQAIAAALKGMAARPDMQSRLPSITIPTLVIVGQSDTITPPDKMRPMAEAMPQATFVEIAGAGHMAPLENPAVVNEAIHRFIAPR